MDELTEQLRRRLTKETKSNIIPLPIQRRTLKEQSREKVLEWLVGYTQDINQTIDELGFGDELMLTIIRKSREDK